MTCFYFWSSMMIFVNLATFSGGVYLFLMKKKILFEWEMLMFFNNLNIYIYIDWISLIFLSTVMMISSMILIYSKSYMSHLSKLLNVRFMFLMLLFILSMVILIFMFNSLTGLILGWDGLGLSSFCLIIFYQNYQALCSGIITMMMNRLGDIMMIISLSVMLMMNLNSFNTDYLTKLILFMIMIAAFTKSAQIPFSPWLLQAMAAPTPVSSLVHSSTLVTAGMYVFIRYNDFFYNSNNMNFMFFIGSLTMFMASFLAIFENDIKKIIALSTLSQLGLMLSILSINLQMLAFFHLLTHAMFKSVLFMCAGVYIHMLKNQDIRFYGNLFNSFPITSMIFLCSIFSLCGFPFLSGFYSKDMIMELLNMSKYNYLSFFLLNSSMCFTCTYSIRLMDKVFFNKQNWLSCSMMKEDKIMYIPMIMMFMQSIFFGFIMMKYFFIYQINIIVLKWYLKMMLIYLMLLSIVFYILIRWMKLFMFKKLNIFINTMMFMEMLYYAKSFKFLYYIGMMLDNFIEKSLIMFIQYTFYDTLFIKKNKMSKMSVFKVSLGILSFILFFLISYMMIS